MGAGLGLKDPSIADEQGILGGPLSLSRFAQADDSSSLASSSIIPGAPTGFVGRASDSAALLAPTLASEGNAMGILGNGEPIAYTVKKGDTLSGVASYFGISVQTITSANPSIRANSLQIGQTLNILPVTGVLYEVKGGEDVESIAAHFGVDPEEIREYNRVARAGVLDAGSYLVIPGATAPKTSLRSSGLPNLDSYFAKPTEGFNWGRLHNYNAVDIANACGTPVRAAAEGLVVDTVTSGWNGGYGLTVLIEHPNGVKTRYAHLEEVHVDIGDYVKQNEDIAVMGNTGNVHGPTGCHLHFEIEGARNPFAR